MLRYKLPSNLGDEIDQLEASIAQFKAGQLPAAELKAQRVPFGVYEQREPDTYMVRLRCAAGSIAVAQLAGVATIAGQYGVGDLHITSRQEMQIHYVKLDDLVTVMRRLQAIGLSTRGGGGNTVRNIVVPVDAGIDPEEVFDVTPYAVALTDRFIAEPDSWNLPRKFKVSFSGSSQDKGYASLSDAGFLAQVKGGRKGFKVYAAGGLGGKPEASHLLLDFIDADDVYPVARALRNVFWKYGNRQNKHAARLRFLWHTLGEADFRKHFHEELSVLKEAGYVPLEINAGTNTGALPQGYVPVFPADPQALAVWQKRYVKAQPQAGLFSVLVPVELGFVGCAATGRLAAFLSSIGNEDVRLTKDQNFFLRNIPAPALGGLFEILKADFPSALKPALYGSLLSCAGASTCQLGICLSRSLAKALLRTFDTAKLDLDRVGGMKLNISGCPNSCGHHQAADLGFAGKTLRKDGHMLPAYTVFTGAVIKDTGTALAQALGDIPAKAVPGVVKELLTGYILKSGNYASFRAYMHGDGREDLRLIVERSQDVPDFELDKNYYFDWGADKIFSLEGRGAGECSAGKEFTVVVKDLRGVLCPLNFVKTKVELAKLKAGDVLEVWLDEGAPIENVPGSVNAEGHKILSQEKAGTYWKVLIEKK